MDKETMEFFQTMFDSLNREIGSLRHEIETRLATKEDLQGFATKEDLERTETRLLTSFHTWASSHEVRSRGISAMTMGFEERLIIIEDRVSKLERERGHA